MKSLPVIVFSSLAALLSLSGCKTLPDVSGVTGTASDTESWASFLSPKELKDILATEKNVVVLDVRSAEQYAAGHIKSALNLPGSAWRTGKATPGQGDSQYIFRDAEGQPDVAKYEALLGGAGLSRFPHVVVYGNHAGKADGTIPAMILIWLGQTRVSFLDGVGIDAWAAAGGAVSTFGTTPPAVKYEAMASDGFVWNLNDVLKGVADGSAQFLDTRSMDEYVGKALRNNKVGGHIPGAIHQDYASLLADDKMVIQKQAARAQLEALGLRKDKPVVMYCQTATRVSLNFMVLKELGYDDLHIYDASWHEYGNTEGVPVEQ